MRIPLPSFTLSSSLLFLFGFFHSSMYAKGQDLEYFDHRHKDQIDILLFGDSGTGKEEQYQVGRAMYQACQEVGCEFALGLGDNIYEAGALSVNDPKFETHFELPYQAFGRFDFWMALGNHDHYLPQSAEAQVQYSQKSERWRMPAKNYSVPGLPDWLHIYAVDSQVFDTSTEGIKAMKRALCGKSGWKLVFGHHPIFSSGKHGSSKRARKMLQGIKECKIQIVMAGHEHHQEHLTAKGFEMIIQGAAGKLRPVKILQYQNSLYQQKYALSKYGFAILTLDKGNMRLRFYNRDGSAFYDTRIPVEKAGQREPFPIPTDRVLQIRSKKKDTCLHSSKNISVHSGNEVYHSKCKDEKADYWKIVESKSVPGAYYIKSERIDKCLHAANHTRAFNGKLNIYNADCDKHNNLFWFQKVGEGYYQIVSLNKKKCVHASGSLRRGNGKQVYQSNCDKNSKRAYRFVLVD